jgi:hypothetical protein
MSEPRCTGAAIRISEDPFDHDFIAAGGSAIADLVWDNGEITTFVWYHDEVSIVEKEFIGKTNEEIHALFHEKDRAYLGS